MVGNIPTDTEKTILKDLVDRSLAAVPGCKVRFVRRVQEPGEQGLLLGLQLPSEIRTNTTEIFKLQDICEGQSRESQLPIGLTVSQPPGNSGLLDLGFLAPEVVAPSFVELDSKKSAQTIAFTAALIILLVLVALLLFKPKEPQVAKTNEQPQIAGPKDQSLIATPQPVPGPGQNSQVVYQRPEVIEAHSTRRQAYTSVDQLPAAAAPPERYWSLDTPPKDQILPGIQTFNSHLPPKIQQLEGPPLNQPEKTVDQPLSDETNESSSRKNSLNELSRYEALLRSKGHIEEADQVEKMILQLP